jgi:hypothetical protein
MGQAKRSSKGGGIIGLIILASMFIILPLGLLAFEIGRFTWATQQLRTSVDAAALAGVAQLAGASLANTQSTQQNAINSAVIIFRQNQVMGDPLASTPDPNGSTPRGTPTNGQNSQNPNNPAPHQAALRIQLLDTNRNEVKLGDVNGRRMRVTGFYGYVPAFGNIVGVGNFTITAVSDGAVPMLDLVICFDVSGSMDDETVVYFVRRRWDPTQIGANGTPGRIVYDIVGNSAGRLFQKLQPPKTGTSVNVLPPQNLSLSSYIDTSPINTRSQGNATPIPFSEFHGQSPPPSPPTPGLRAVNTANNPAASEVGRPPGNFSYIDPLYNKGEDNNSVSSGNVNVDANCAPIYTDLIVNIGTSALFPGIGTAVEASRGNLDTDQARTNSKASTVPGMPGASSGYQMSYQTRASMASVPINFSRTETNNFVDLMMTNTDAHFGLTAFSDDVNQSLTLPNVDSHWPLAGNGNFSVPLVQLSNSVANNDTVKTAVSSLKPLGKTNIYAALTEAINELTSNASRSESRKAIILFTDGIPNKGISSAGPGSPTGFNSPAAQDARTAAQRAKDNGIPIYCIGLSNNGSLATDMNVFLKETAPSGSQPPGLAYMTNGRYWNVNNATQLQQAFRQIARELVQLVNTF